MKMILYDLRMILNVRNSRKVLVLFFGLILFSWGSANAYSEDEAKKVSEEIKKSGFETVTTKEGFNFKIPSDMPIETRNGVVAPVPFEEYLYVKFKKIDEKLSEVDKKIDKLQTTLDKISTGVNQPNKLSSGPGANS